LNIGPAMLKVRAVGRDRNSEETLDPAVLAAEDEMVGTQVGGWYQTFMEIADNLESLAEPDRMIQTVMDGILTSTGVDRVMVQLEPEFAAVGQSAYYLASGGEAIAFGVSQSILQRAKDSRQVVHVPMASADPVASQLHSVRREGISSSIALPLRALGKNLGVLYADCVREGAVLTAADLQRVVFIGRLLASALGNRDLVSSLVRAEPAMDAAVHPALQTSSPACADMVERVKLYAPADYTVLIRGETGTGKEVIARALHELSRRKKGPFIAVNCAAIPEQLMESILFGHEKGAFTGATQARRGHFEAANGGTLFLDEIGDMASDLQAKILRVLQDRIVSPVGSQRQIAVDVRILAATNQDLDRATRKGRFREDLYYRLRELEIVLPRLRERVEDILMLSNQFLLEAAGELGYEQIPELTAETLDHLHRLSWRGNIRELRHVIKAAALRAAGGPILVKHLEPTRAPESLAAGEAALEAAVNDTGESTFKERLEAQEREALLQTLRMADGNLTKGAELFGVPRTTYREKLVKNGLLGQNK
ncbi:MAG: sigma-54-dependent Fis family transcriptional regulator, partial [Planctomycetota bacterium]